MIDFCHFNVFLWLSHSFQTNKCARRRRLPSICRTTTPPFIYSFRINACAATFAQTKAFVNGTRVSRAACVCVYVSLLLLSRRKTVITCTVYTAFCLFLLKVEIMFLRFDCFGFCLFSLQFDIITACNPHSTHTHTSTIAARLVKFIHRDATTYVFGDNKRWCYVCWLLAGVCYYGV